MIKHIIVLILVALALSACGSSPLDTGQASVNTYCGHGVYGKINKDDGVTCPN
jgi:hypothetical protein